MTAPTIATQTSVPDLVAMIQAITPNTRRVLNGITWEEYKELSAAFPDTAKVRLAYHQGTLEVMTLGITHEHQKDSLLRLVSLIADALEIDVESIGSTTLSNAEVESGAEPDAAFYLTHAQAMIGCKVLDLDQNPPPDVVIEVDITNPSWNKRGVYAQLGVPELWHLVQTKLTIYGLQATTYQPQNQSLAFPFLTADALTEFLEECATEGQSKALRNFRKLYATELIPKK